MRANLSKDVACVSLKLSDLHLPVPSGMVNLQGLLEEMAPEIDKEITAALKRIGVKWREVINSPAYRIHLVTKKEVVTKNHQLSKAVRKRK